MNLDDLEDKLENLESIFWFKEELKPNSENLETKSETNIDWNFVLGLVFGIEYLIFRNFT